MVNNKIGLLPLESFFELSRSWNMTVTLRFLTVMVFISILHLECRAQGAASPRTDARVGFSYEEGKPQRQPLHQYRFYVGVHAAAQVFQVTSTTYPMQEAVVRPIYVFAGYQFGPHVALQTGFIQQQRPILDNSGVQFDRMGLPFDFTEYYNEYNGAIPVLLRYDLAHRPPRRLHLDVLLGLTLVIHRYQVDYVTSATANQKAYEQHDFARSNNFYAVAGLGIGYRAIPHVDLMMEASMNRNLSAPDDAAGARIISFGVGAGLRYHFNLSRSASQTLVR